MTTHTDAAAPGPVEGTQRLVALLEERARGAAAGRPYLMHARTGRQVTYGELADAARRWWELFDCRRVPPGGLVALAVTDPVQFAVVYLAAVSGGRRVVPVAADTPGAQLARLAPDLVVADHAIAVGDGVVTPDAYQDVAPPAGTSRAMPRASAGGVLMSSSGTTGTPKRIFLDTDRLLHVATAIADHHQLTPADTGYSPLPLVHINAQVVGLLATLVAGGELVLDPRFQRRGFWELIHDHGVSWINAVPAILAILTRTPAPTPEQTRSVRFARSASAPLPLAVLTAFERVTGLPVVETYGMTEAASQITANPVDGRRKPGSVGRPVGTQVRVMRPDGRPCPPGGTGHVQIRGRGVISLYAGAAGNERFREDGWLDTGDLGWLDEDGYLFLAGRTDDVINRGGEKIYPREVEEVLLADPRVGRAVVYGMPDEVLGQVPAARVVPVDRIDSDRLGQSAAVVAPLLGPRADAAGALVSALSERCSATLARHKRPVRIEVVDDIPVGQTGKVLRRLLDVGAPGDGHEAA